MPFCVVARLLSVSYKHLSLKKSLLISIENTLGVLGGCILSIVYVTVNISW